MPGYAYFDGDLMPSLSGGDSCEQRATRARKCSKAALGSSTEELYSEFTIR